MFSVSRLSLLVAVAALAVLCFRSGSGAAEIEFRYAIDNSPLDVSPKPREKLTDAVLEFRKTGDNPYNGDQKMIAEGKRLYALNCQSCHLPSGAGGMGSSLIDEQHVYEQVKHDVGLFEVIFGGAAGAMQPFSKRLSQDQILKVMAYVRTLMKP